MENREIDLVVLFKAVWRRRKNVYKWGLMGLILGIIVAFSIPREYESKMEIVLESSQKGVSGSAGALAGMMGINLTGGDSKGGLNEQIYPQILKSTPFLVEFSDIPVNFDAEEQPLWKYMFYNQKRAWWSYILSAPGNFIGWVASIGNPNADTIPTSLNTKQLEVAFAGTLKSRITIETDTKSGVYIVSATMQDAKISQQLADSVMVQLERYMTKYRTAKSEENLRTSIVMMRDARDAYYVADSIYATTADRNQNLISKAAQIKIERLRDERNLAFNIYQQLSSQVEMDRIKLKEDTPIATIIEPTFEPTSATKPNRKLIIVGLTLLFIFGAAGAITIREIAKK